MEVNPSPAKTRNTPANQSVVSLKSARSLKSSQDSARKSKKSATPKKPKTSSKRVSSVNADFQRDLPTIIDKHHFRSTVKEQLAKEIKKISASKTLSPRTKKRILQRIQLNYDKAS